MSTKTRADETETRSHEHTLTIEAPPEVIWEAITDPEALTRWFPFEADVQPGPGGVIRYAWGNLECVCRIEAWEPPRHLRTTWMEHAVGQEGPSVERGRLAVDWSVEGQGGRTVLRLVHSGFGANKRWEDEYDGTRRGWAFELRSLRQYLEHHAGRPRRAFWARRPVDLPADAVWSRLTRAGGLVREGRIDGLAPQDSYRITLSTGDSLEGRVLIQEPPFLFAGTVDNLGHGLLRFGYETCSGGPEALLWLSTWGRPDADGEALERKWNAALEQIFRSV